MQFTALLGKALKSDEVIEVLENFDISVTYDFDRSYENISDLYWAPSKEAGFQFRFNKDQVLDVVFVYLVPREGFTAIDRSLLNVQVFETFDEAQSFCIQANIPYRASAGEPGTESYKWWVKLDHAHYTAHYQFKEGQVIMLTLSAKSGA
ncbi:hypothetical protein [Shewanella baltica]|uniref:hypothetical protein n=1 Tax=Shewanella baltica TaxID=62322 RepID=UPI00321839E3